MIYNRDKIAKYLLNEKQEFPELERYAVPYVVKKDTGQYVAIQPSGDFHVTNIALHATEGKWHGKEFDAKNGASAHQLAESMGASITSQEQINNALSQIGTEVEHIGWAPSDYKIKAFIMPDKLKGSKITQPDWGKNEMQQLDPATQVLVVVSATGKNIEVTDCYANSKKDFKDWAKVGDRELSGDSLIETLPVLNVDELKNCLQSPDAKIDSGNIKKANKANIKSGI